MNECLKIIDLKMQQNFVHINHQQCQSGDSHIVVFTQLNGIPLMATTLEWHLIVKLQGRFLCGQLRIVAAPILTLR